MRRMVVSDETLARQPLRTYSGGMKRRIGIAQALPGDPRLLIDAARDRTILLSTHIVEDISHSARSLAVMRRGRVIWQGAAADLVERARGHVWTVAGERPPEGMTLVSAGAEGVYRVIGESAPPGGSPTEPTLEDACLWLMRTT